MVYSRDRRFDALYSDESGCEKMDRNYDWFSYACGSHCRNYDADFVGEKDRVVDGIGLYDMM